MVITTQEINKIAYLARLKIDAKDIASYAEDLSGILALVEQMNAVNADAVLPMAHPMDQKQHLRLDVVTEKNQRKLFQDQAPQVEAGLYLLPQVIE